MVGLACPESWAPLPNLLHLPQHQLQQRWRVPGSAASCSSSTASEQQHHVQGGLGMLMPARWGSSNSSSSSICGGRNNSGLEQIGMGYCGMPLELLPEFSHHHPQQQQQLGMVGKAAGNSSLSACLEHRGRQLLHLDDPDIAALQLLHATASGGSHWTRAPDFSPGPSFLSQMQQHSPCCTCDDNMMDEVAVSGTAGGCTTAQQQQVMHWADHIHHVARGGGGGKDAGAAHGGEMEVFSAAAAFQFGDSSCSDYGVHHWLKEAELEEPGPSDLLLDFLHGSSRAGSGGEHELHDCKLIGIQDYLPDLEHEHDDPCRLITTVVGPPPDLGVVSGLSSADAAQEQSPSILSSPRPIAGPREEEVHASVLASEQLRFGDLGCAAVAMAFKSALPAWPPAHEKMAAEDGGCRQPAGAALSRSSSRRRLSLEQVMPDEPLATPKVGQESPKEKKTSSLAAANAHAARSRRSPKAGKATSSRESAQWTSSNAAVSVDPEEVVLPSTTLLDTSPTPPPPPGDKNERGKRKSSTSSPPAQQKRSRKAATQDGDKEKDKPAQRRAPARTSQAAAASRKRTRQNEQPVEAAAAAEAGEDGQQMDAVVPKKGSKAAAGAGTKRRRTSPATATSPAAAAAPESGCKPQPTKKTRRSPRSARGAAGAAGAKQEEEEEPLPPSSERESHVIAERRRRRSMNFMLSTLGSLLPAEGTPKATDRLKVVAQTISYIKEMQVSLKALTQKKAELTVAQSLLHSSHHVLAASAKFPEHPSSQTSSTSQLDEAHPSWDNLEAGSCDGAGGCVARKQPSPPVLTLDIFGMEAFITLSCAKSRPDFFCKTLLLLDQLRFKVVTAQKSTNDQMAYHSIHVNNKESEKENKDLKSALERLMNSVSTAG